MRKNKQSTEGQNRPDEAPGSEFRQRAHHLTEAQKCSRERSDAPGTTATGHRNENPLLEKYADSKTGRIDMIRLVDGTGLTRMSLAGMLGVSTDAVYRTSRVNSPAMQAKMRETLEILGRIMEWTGGEVQAMAWYRAQPIPAFGGRTAESLFKSNQVEPLREYLDRMATGGFA